VGVGICTGKWDYDIIRRMLNSICVLVAATLIVVSFIGCAVPVLPGPALALCGVLSLLPSRFAPTTNTCVMFGVACAVVLLLDYVVPAFGAKKFNCSRWGVFGCFAGTIVGIFFAPWGILLGPFVGAVLGETVAGKNFGSSLKGGFGALLGFLFGITLKIAYCATCAGWCAVKLIDSL